MKWWWLSENWSWRMNEKRNNKLCLISRVDAGVPGMVEYENTKCNFNIVEYNKYQFNTKIEKHTAHSMLQSSPRVFQWNRSHQRLSHLPCMMFSILSNNSRRRCWRCVWRLKWRGLRHNEWWWLSENWSWRMNEKRNNKLCQIGRVDVECLEWSNIRIQNAISIL